jgi:hypothetical protein
MFCASAHTAPSTNRSSDFSTGERRLQASNRRRENPSAVNDLPHAERSGETLDQPRRRNQKGAVHTNSTGLRLSCAGSMALLRASADRCDGFR